MSISLQSPRGLCCQEVPLCIPLGLLLLHRVPVSWWGGSGFRWWVRGVSPCPSLPSAPNSKQHNRTRAQRVNWTEGVIFGSGHFLCKMIPAQTLSYLLPQHSCCLCRPGLCGEGGHHGERPCQLSLCARCGAPREPSPHSWPLVPPSLPTGAVTLAAWMREPSSRVCCHLDTHVVLKGCSWRTKAHTHTPFYFYLFLICFY